MPKKPQKPIRAKLDDLDKVFEFEHERLMISQAGQFYVRTQACDAFFGRQWKPLDTGDLWARFSEMEKTGNAPPLRTREFFKPLTHLQAMRWYVSKMVPTELERDFFSAISLYAQAIKVCGAEKGKTGAKS